MASDLHQSFCLSFSFHSALTYMWFPSLLTQCLHRVFKMSVRFFVNQREKLSAIHHGGSEASWQRPWFHLETRALCYYILIAWPQVFHLATSRGRFLCWLHKRKPFLSFRPLFVWQSQRFYASGAFFYSWKGDVHMRIWMIIALEVFDFSVCCWMVFYLMRWACHLI